jgi:hypothetical protein
MRQQTTAFQNAQPQLQPHTAVIAAPGSADAIAECMFAPAVSTRFFRGMPQRPAYGFEEAWRDALAASGTYSLRRSAFVSPYAAYIAPKVSQQKKFGGTSYAAGIAAQQSATSTATAAARMYAAAGFASTVLPTTDAAAAGGGATGGGANGGGGRGGTNAAQAKRNAAEAAAVQAALLAATQVPEFLFIIETPPPPGSVAAARSAAGGANPSGNAPPPLAVALNARTAMRRIRALAPISTPALLQLSAGSWYVPARAFAPAIVAAAAPPPSASPAQAERLAAQRQMLALMLSHAEEAARPAVENAKSGGPRPSAAALAALATVRRLERQRKQVQAQQVASAQRRSRYFTTGGIFAAAVMADELTLAHQATPHGNANGVNNAPSYASSHMGAFGLGGGTTEGPSLFNGLAIPSAMVQPSMYGAVEQAFLSAAALTAATQEQLDLQELGASAAVARNMKRRRSLAAAAMTSGAGAATATATGVAATADGGGAAAAGGVNGAIGVGAGGVGGAVLNSEAGPTQDPLLPAVVRAQALGLAERRALTAAAVAAVGAASTAAVMLQGPAAKLKK